MPDFRLGSAIQLKLGIAALPMLAFSLLFPNAAFAQEVFASPEQRKQLFEAAKDRQKISLNIRLFSQVIAFDQPSRLVFAYRAEQDSRFIYESVLPEETVYNWTEMLTIIANAGVAGFHGVSAEGYAKAIASRYQALCPDTFVFKDLGPVKGAEFKSHRAVFACRTLPDQISKNYPQSMGEMTLVQTIQGSKDMYSIQYAMRGPSFSQSNLLMNQHQLNERLLYLDSIRLCDPDAQDEPCKQIALLAKAVN